MDCGLIGRKLGHSFSPKIHSLLGNYPYRLIPLEPEEVGDFLRKGEFHGLNVTIPYKRTVMEYCAELTPAARHIGSVNTILRRPDGTLLGDNTDYDGFLYLLKSAGAQVEGRKALVLGGGGASLAVQYALTEAGIPYAVVSRDPARGNFLYDDLRPEVVAGHRLIVNATPVGTFPHVDEAPLLPYEALTAAHYLFDLVYNPERTQFLLRGERQGARTLNGLPMLEAQAEASWRIWNGVI